MNSQVRYNGTIYDVLGNVSFDKYQYSIIGTGSDKKFFDIAFIEKVIENEKIRYIMPSSDNGQLDSLKMMSQSLLDHIVNDIKDCINQDILLTRDETINYVNNCIEVLEQEDIRSLFAIRNDIYDNNQLDERMKRIMSLYDSNIDKKTKKVEPSFFTNDESNKTVKDIYDKLEDTQNFGVSIIHDYDSLIQTNNGEYISDPANHIYEEKEEVNRQSVVSSENISVANEEDTLLENEELIIQANDEHNFNTNADKLTVSDIKFMLEKKNDTMTLQQRLYWENELKRKDEVSQPDVSQINMGNPNKTYTLSNGKSLLKENAAYVSIYFLIALIGSFELLLTVIMLAKF